jgi:hypothetical protein
MRRVEQTADEELRARERAGLSVRSDADRTSTDRSVG